MEIERQEKEKATILIPKGDLIYKGIDELETLFKELSDSARFVILDLTHTRYLSAKTLGIIAFYIKPFRNKQGGLKLVNVNENIKKLLYVTDIIKVIEIFDDEDAALASISPQVGNLEKMLLWSKEGFV
ncbi:MAG: STAS domain-containing protein [Candidatus Brocadia sp.]|nr:STAS domain-containing protein [Candidatus Brocadia sp.]NUO07126.1 STAS domain-containing protein [Candidatus Brocadia sp.]